MRKIIFLLGLVCFCANAAEIYKWTDENGKVHFGDRLAAPADSEEMDVKVQPPINSPARANDQAKPRAQNTQSLHPAPRIHLGLANPIRVDPASVSQKCNELIGEIAAKVKQRENWNSLSKAFNNACPGIAYECTTYRTHPENNKCSWIKRSGGAILVTSDDE